MQSINSIGSHVHDQEADRKKTEKPETAVLQKRNEKPDLFLGCYVKELNSKIIWKGSKTIRTLEVKKTKMEIIHNRMEEPESKAKRKIS